MNYDHRLQLLTCPDCDFETVFVGRIASDPELRCIVQQKIERGHKCRKRPKFDVRTLKPTSVEELQRRVWMQAGKQVRIMEAAMVRGEEKIEQDMRRSLAQKVVVVAPGSYPDGRTVAS